VDSVFKGIVADIDAIGRAHPIIAFGPPPIEWCLGSTVWLVYDPRVRCFVHTPARILSND